MLSFILLNGAKQFCWWGDFSVNAESKKPDIVLVGLFFSSIHSYSLKQNTKSASLAVKVLTLIIAAIIADHVLQKQTFLMENLSLQVIKPDAFPPLSISM